MELCLILRAITGLKMLYDDQYKIETLCYLRRLNANGNYEYLLGKHYKQGKWNGFGGKVGDKAEFRNETVEASLKREGKEEFGIQVIAPQKRGVLLFTFYDENWKENKVLCHLFFADSWAGEVRASNEMLTPTWFDFKHIPWDEMWPNDRMWFEEVLKRDEFLNAEFKFDPMKGLIASETKMKWKVLPNS
jgi:8-oxo-dGTP pyrophosphatase MutT (NUDIX family)